MSKKTKTNTTAAPATTTKKTAKTAAPVKKPVVEVTKTKTKTAAVKQPTIAKPKKVKADKKGATPETNATGKNRYDILNDTIKALAGERKIAKQTCQDAIDAAMAQYRAYVNDTYNPARLAAFETFNKSCVRTYNRKTDQVPDPVDPTV